MELKCLCSLKHCVTKAIFSEEVRTGLLSRYLQQVLLHRHHLSLCFLSFPSDADLHNKLSIYLGLSSGCYKHSHFSMFLMSHLDASNFSYYHEVQNQNLPSCTLTSFCQQIKIPNSSASKTKHGGERKATSPQLCSFSNGHMVSLLRMAQRILGDLGWGPSWPFCSETEVLPAPIGNRLTFLCSYQYVAPFLEAWRFPPGVGL